MEPPMNHPDGNDPIFRAWFDATNCYLAGAGLPPLKEHKTESDEFRFSDEDRDEPDRYPDDRYLDAPEHDQCCNGRFVP